jgi:predicted MFS family arabinose efflux permease
VTQHAAGGAAASAEPTRFTGYQKFVIAVLAFLQFTIILDFMILSPLGAILMPALKISPTQFGTVVSAYAFSAGASGLLAGGFADKFDRKKLLLFFYVGFLIGTSLCAMATTYEFLLIARMVTGLFGGVIGSIVFAITTDLFPFSQRGRVMGVIQTAFAGSQIMGIPLGLFIATHLNWHWTFILIVAVGIAAGAVIAVFLQPIAEHLKLQDNNRRPFSHLIETVTNKRYLQGFATVALLATGGFMLMPFGSAFSVNNLGIDLEHLPIVYLCTGVISMISGPYVGKLSDRFGKFHAFVAGSCLTIVMVAVYTRLGVTPIFTVVIVSSLMFVGVQARMISSQALMSAIPAPASRGSFMSVSSSVQQVSGGVASVLAGLIVVEEAGGKLLNFDLLGEVVIGATVVTMAMMWTIHRLVPEPATPTPASVPKGA